MSYIPPKPVRRNLGGRPRTSTNPNGTSARGYGAAHRRQRAAWAPRVATGLVNCALCGEKIRPDQKWHLAHADCANAHRDGIYSGPAHALCNNGTNRRRLRTRKRAKALAIFDTPGRNSTT
jgi:hypothetical protein